MLTLSDLVSRDIRFMKIASAGRLYTEHQLDYTSST